MVVRGRNSLSLSAPDAGTWVLLVQLARRRTAEQVKCLMAPPESLEEAVARVRRQVGGGDGSGEAEGRLRALPSPLWRRPLTCFWSPAKTLPLSLHLPSLSPSPSPYPQTTTC